MLYSISDIITELLVRGRTNTTVGFHTDSSIKGNVEAAYRWAARYKKWPVTEGRSSTTWSSSNEEWNYPENWMPDSIRILQVGGKAFDKTNFYDYQKYRENYPTGNDKIFSDFGGLYYINPNASVSGTLTVFGQYIPAKLDFTIDNTTLVTVFSGWDEGGNEAIVNEALSYMKEREQKPQEAQYYHSRAMEVLNQLWESVQNEQYAYQVKDRGMFKRINVLEGAIEDELLKRDQFI